MTNDNQNLGQGKPEQQAPNYNSRPAYRQTGYPTQGAQTTPPYTGQPTYMGQPTYSTQAFPGTMTTGQFPTMQGMPAQGQPGFMGAGAFTPGGTPVSPQQGAIPLPAMQQSYIENILRMNLEKVATVYMTFEHDGGSESKAFRGEIEAAGRDHVIINDNKTGTRYLLPLIYLDYVTFQGPINYSYPFA
ncbi:MAG: spore coat protein GerQ [Tuberibacillus sp.]